MMTPEETGAIRAVMMSRRFPDFQFGVSCFEFWTLLRFHGPGQVVAERKGCRI